MSAEQHNSKGDPPVVANQNDQHGGAPPLTPSELHGGGEVPAVADAAASGLHKTPTGGKRRSRKSKKSTKRKGKKSSKYGGRKQNKSKGKGTKRHRTSKVGGNPQQHQQQHQQE